MKGQRIQNEDLVRRVAQAAKTSPRQRRASTIASLIRTSRGYRWVGIYEVGNDDIFVLGWSGPNAPRHPRFSRDSGLCGRAVASRNIVCVDDVTEDPDYLTTLSSTRSEIVVPILDSFRNAIGLIDVESQEIAAFSADDNDVLTRCATAAASLWT
jgi:putative methionine-R-sulfoxide reductase with GAF domain